jgi:HSP20 family protein
MAILNKEKLMTKWTVQRVPRSVIEKELEFNRDNLLSTFDKFFDEALRGQFPDVYKGFGIEPFSKSAYPKVNVLSFDDKIEIEAEIAGYNKEDISIQVEDDVLSIVGKASQQTEQTDKSVYLLRELKRSSFSRSFRLTDQLDSDRIDARFYNGLLHITIPRKVQTKENKAKTVVIK